MIPEYLNLEKIVADRACHIGRVIQSKHHVMNITPFPAVVPRLGPIQADHVAISIGKDEDGTVHVLVPLGLFETAGDMDMLVWINIQNDLFRKAQNEQELAHATENRTREVEIMKELMLKYPDEIPAKKLLSAPFPLPTPDYAIPVPVSGVSSEE